MKKAIPIAVIAASLVIAFGWALLSCAQPAASSERLTLLEQLTTATSCAVADAIPNDGIDDGPAIRGALESGARCAELGPGEYDVETRRDTGHYYDMLLLSGGARLRGAGPTTTLRFSGTSEQHDWRGIALTGDDNEVADLRIDTSALTDTEEQTHAVYVRGPVTGASIHGITFAHPERGPTPGSLAGGDCLMVSGYENGQRVESLRIYGNAFAECDRSGVSIHGGTHGLVIADNTFAGTGDQDIDAESTEPNSDWAITGNVIRHAGSPWAVDLTGSQLERLTFANNTIDGGGVFTTNISQASITGNVIASSATALKMIKTSEDVVISGNAITLLAGGPANHSNISISHQSGSRPGSLLIAGNRLRNYATATMLVSLQSERDATITGNTLEWSPAATPPGVVAFIYTGGTGARVDSLLVSGNTLRASAPAWGVYASATSEYGVDRLTVVGNSYIGLSVGLRCDNFAAGTVVSTGNQGAPNQCAIATGGI